jgi:hypothetical protein
VPQCAQSSSAAPPHRDTRRDFLTLSNSRIHLASERDTAAVSADPPRIAIAGHRLRLRKLSRRNYEGGTITEFESAQSFPKKGGELAISDPATAAAEPILLTLSVEPPFCLTEGSSGRLLADQVKARAVGEIFVAPSSPARFTITPQLAGSACPPTVLPPPPETGRRSSHLDHTPRHDGVFFMAEDGFHHLEGVCGCKAFTLYLYDDRVLPLPVLSARGRIEGESVPARPLEPDPAGTTLAVALPAGAKPPFDLTLRARLAPGLPEQRFDFHFPFCEPCAKKN